MGKITFAKEYDIAEAFDVIVCGAGPSGVAAAVKSARKGAKTLLIEKTYCAGGMWTGGLVTPLFDGANKDGIMKEIIDNLRERKAYGGFWDKSFQFETLKTLLDELLTESGVTVLFDTLVTGVRTESGKILGVFAENRGGSYYYPAKVFIDCTGDAIIAYQAGVKCFIGDDKTQSVQSATLMFTIGHVNYLQQTSKDLSDLIEKAIADNDLPYQLPFDKPYVIQIPNTDMAVVQLTHIYGIDPMDGFCTSLAVIEGRRQANEVFRVMKDYIPEFKDIVLLETAPFLGIRESRRIDGEYCITVNDCINGTRPEDTVAVCTFNMDIHESSSDKQTNIRTKAYGIPYRAMLPKGIQNLLVAGKTISGSHEAMASYRVTGNCVAMGEAAGSAAAESVIRSISLRELTIEEIMQ